MTQHRSIRRSFPIDQDTGQVMVEIGEKIIAAYSIPIMSMMDESDYSDYERRVRRLDEDPFHALERRTAAEQAALQRRAGLIRESLLHPWEIGIDAPASSRRVRRKPLTVRAKARLMSWLRKEDRVRRDDSG